RHFLRVHRWEGDSLLYFSYIPGSKEVAQSLVVTWQASPNQLVHLIGVPLRFIPTGNFIVFERNAKDRTTFKIIKQEKSK
ncbi:MAG: hypothetical protein J7K96_13160, partial [Desulfobacteraceae bacterium]|nr:hypothetical protein [Desulfobacteraceae bacterium]